MRYHRNRPNITLVCLGASVGVLVSQTLYPSYSPGAALETMVGVALAQVILRYAQYWEIQPDGLTRVCFLEKDVWRFGEIAYVGPPRGILVGVSWARGWIEVAKSSGEQMLITNLANPKGFIAEMRARVPDVTHDVKA